jgi:hypothetical protein
MDDLPPKPNALARSPNTIRWTFQLEFGLKSNIYNAALVRELLGGVMRPCTLCEGSGVFGTSGIYWRKCPACQGLGEVYSISDEELQRRRQLVLEAYPEAGIPDWVPVKQVRHPIWNKQMCLLVDGDTGERVETTELA